MLETLRKTLLLLSRRERRRGLLVMAMVIVMAMLEAVGVASVMPFLAVLGDPEVVHTNPWLAAVYEWFGFESPQRFLLLLGLLAFGLVITAAVFRVLTLYAMNRWVQMRRHSIGRRLLETYLRQPYAFFLSRHSGDMAKSILSEVDQLVENVYKPGFDLVAYSVVALVLVMLLVVIDPWLALAVGAVIGGLYALVYLSVKGLLSRIGRERAAANRERFTAAGEALGGIKDIKLLGREFAYLSRFEPSSIRYARHQATNRTLSTVPKYVVEAFAVGGVLLLALVLLARSGEGVGSILPILGLYAFAGYRLMPAAQHIYSGLARLRFGAAAVDEVYRDLEQRSSLAEIRHAARERLTPQRCIAFQQVSFVYPDAEEAALHNLSLEIPVGQSIGLVGGSGAGKTTMVDLLLGLLRPTEGSLLIDGTPLTEDNLRAWQNALGYVPQSIFLTDATIAENIALGETLAELDMERVEACARMAQVHEFVSEELPQGYRSSVGERGVRLSGGQRQRLGIARALYHDPPVLVFDEATSALDNETEAAVMAAVERLGGEKTIIIIAHRLTTVQHCDNIVLLHKGAVRASGPYATLLREEPEFARLARQNEALP